MSILQAYQEDLLRDLDKGERVGPNTVKVLIRDMDLSLQATKETARAIGHREAALAKSL